MFNEKEKAELLGLKNAYASLPFYKKLWLHLCSWRLARALANIHPDTTSVSNVIELFELYARAWFMNTAYGILSNFGLTAVFQSSMTTNETKNKYAYLSSWGYPRNEKNSVLHDVQQNGGALVYALAELKNDREIVLAAVQQDGEALEHASADLKNDKDIVMAAVQKHGWALEYASAELKNDKGIVMAAVQKHGWALEYASAELKNDKGIVMAAVRQDGRAFEYASAELKNDKGMVMAAVQQDGRALEYASEELKKDKGIVMAAVQKHGWALEYASAELKNDKGIVMAAVQKHGWALEYASAELKNDRDIVMAAVQKSGCVLEHASEELKNDKDIVIAAVQQDGRALQYASAELRRDCTLVLEVIKKCPHACQWVDIELRRTFDFMMAACEVNHQVLGYLPILLHSNKEQLLVAAVKQACQHDGRFILSTKLCALHYNILSLFQKYPVRELELGHLLDEQRFYNTISNLPYEFWRETSLIKITRGERVMFVPQHIKNALIDNQTVQQSYVIGASFWLFSENNKYSERAELIQAHFPYKVVLNIMSFLPYFFTSSGYRTAGQLLERNSAANETNIDDFIPAMSLYWAATALMMRKNTRIIPKAECETRAESRVEVLREDEASSRPSAEAESEIIVYTPNR